MDPLQPFHFLKRLVNKSGSKKLKFDNSSEESHKTRVQNIEGDNLKLTRNQERNSNRSNKRSSRKDQKVHRNSKCVPLNNVKQCRSPCCRAKVYSVTNSGETNRWNFNDDDSGSESEPLTRSGGRQRRSSDVMSNSDAYCSTERSQRDQQSSSRHSKSPSASASGSSYEEEEDQYFYNSSEYQTVLMEDACQHNYNELADRGHASGGSSDEDDELVRLTSHMTFDRHDLGRGRILSDGEISLSPRAKVDADESLVNDDVLFRPVVKSSVPEAGDCRDATPVPVKGKGNAHRAENPIRIPEIQVTLVPTNISEEELPNLTSGTPCCDVTGELNQLPSVGRWTPTSSISYRSSQEEHQSLQMTRTRSVEPTTSEKGTEENQSADVTFSYLWPKLVRFFCIGDMSSTVTADYGHVQSEVVKEVIIKLFQHCARVEKKLQQTEWLYHQKSSIVREQRQKIATLLYDNKDLVDKGVVREKQFNDCKSKYKTNLMQLRSQVTALLSKRGHKLAMKSVVADVICAREQIDLLNLYKFDLQNKVNELRMLVVQQQRKITQLQQSEYTLKNENEELGQKLSRHSEAEAAPGNPKRTWVREYLTTKMGDVMDCDAGCFDILACNMKPEGDHGYFQPFDPTSISYVMYEATDRGQDVQTVADLIAEIESNSGPLDPSESSQ